MPPRRRSSQNANPTAGQNDAPGAVYGPRSALTSFLREQGITGPGASFTGRVRHPPPGGGGGAESDTATAAAPSSASTSAGLSTPPARGSDNTTGYTSVLLTTSNTDADDVAASTSAASPIASTSASTVASTSSSKRRSTAAGPSAAQLKKQKKEQHDEFLLAGKPQGPAKKARYEGRTPGSIAVCAECGKKFTVTKYTVSNPNGPGVLCSPCTSESIEDRASFPAAAKPKTKPQKKKAQKSIDEGQYKPVTTLQQSCLSVIGQYINDVEALGDIGASNLDRVAKIVCKNRALNGENLKLFLEVGHRELKLYDCTNINHSDLASISTFCPHLEKLSLNLCGRFDDEVIDAWSKGLKELRHLSLYGTSQATLSIAGRSFIVPDRPLETLIVSSCNSALPRHRQQMERVLPSSSGRRARTRLVRT
ncbi:hypothetical protein JCM10212_001080 [Sporobolomyces blumeae]